MAPDEIPASARRSLDDRQLQRATRVVELAWSDLPAADRQLLDDIGAARWRVVDMPLGEYTNALLASSGAPRLSSAGCAELDRAVGVWISQLRVVLIDAAHHALAALDQVNYEMMLARTAWHEWAHALSVDRAEADDIAAGKRLLELAPPGVEAIVRSGRYRRSEYTHEIVAEVYALLMLRRRYGARGQPAWLRDEIYHLVRRVSGWNE